MQRIILLCCTVLIPAAAGCYDSKNDESDLQVDPAPDPAGDRDLVQDPFEEDMPADMPMDAPVEDALPDPIEDGTDAADAPGCEEGCMAGLICCDERCVNPMHDPEHCSACGNPCTGSTPFCASGLCTARPCEIDCIGTRFCCGMSCCDMEQICCEVDGPGPGMGPACYDGFCPGGCPLCL
jgi:hypothetical protein